MIQNTTPGIFNYFCVTIRDSRGLSSLSSPNRQMLYAERHFDSTGNPHRPQSTHASLEKFAWKMRIRVTNLTPRRFAAFYPAHSGKPVQLLLWKFQTETQGSHWTGEQRSPKLSY